MTRARAAYRSAKADSDSVHLDSDGRRRAVGGDAAAKAKAKGAVGGRRQGSRRWLSRVFVMCVWAAAAYALAGLSVTWSVGPREHAAADRTMRLPPIAGAVRVELAGKAAGGAHVTLSAWMCGNVSSSAPLVVLLHGFPDTAGTFKHQMRRLCDEDGGAKWRVIAPVQRGYELSSAVDGDDYSLAALADDALAWCRKLRADKDGGGVHVVGHDWGAAVAYAFGALHGSSINLRSVTTLAVPHGMDAGLYRLPSQILNSWYMLFFQLPWAPELLLGLPAKHVLLLKLWRAWSPTWAGLGAAFGEDVGGVHAGADVRDAVEALSSVSAAFSHPSIVRAAVGYYRRNVIIGLLPRAFFAARGDANAVRTSVAMDMATPIHAPTLAIGGTDDGCIDTRMYDVVRDESLRAFVGGLRVEKVRGVGHFVQLEAPDETTDLLVRWLDSH